MHIVPGMTKQTRSLLPRKKGEMTKVYKEMSGVKRVNRDRLFIVSSKTRTTLSDGRSKTDERRFTTKTHGLARNGLPQEAESLYRLKKQLDKLRRKEIHQGQLNTQIPPVAQKVRELQSLEAGGWFWGDVSLHASLLYSPHNMFWSLLSAEYFTRWALDLTQHGSSHAFHTLCQPLSFHY